MFSREQLCLFRVFKMFMKIESTALCEVRSVIHFLSARNLSAADIYRQICEVYRPITMCKDKLHKWVRDFKASCDSIGWDVSDHSPYSLDLTPSDFHLFSCLKHYFGGNQSRDKMTVKTVLTS